MENTVQPINIRLYVYEMGQDDPKKCTSAKLRRLHLATRISHPSHIHKNAIVLNPTVTDVLSREDREVMERGGLVVIDCSWNKTEAVYSRIFKGMNRRLPLLIAGNPTNYGCVAKLSSAEAFAAALHIAGFKKQAEIVILKFKWGKSFMALNWELLEKYSLARSVGDILKIERSYFSGSGLDLS